MEAKNFTTTLKSAFLNNTTWSADNPTQQRTGIGQDLRIVGNHQVNFQSQVLSYCIIKLPPTVSNAKLALLQEMKLISAN